METILAAFDTNTIHGYNPQYRDAGVNGRFDAFEMHHIQPRPVRFHNEVVTGTQLLDHQGHVVPQTSYAQRLMAIATQIDHDLNNGHGPYNLANATARLVHHYPAMNIQTVTTYIQNQLIAARVANWAERHLRAGRSVRYGPFLLEDVAPAPEGLILASGAPATARLSGAPQIFGYISTIFPESPNPDLTIVWPT